ncbi:SAM-dependent methyltransferase [Acidobacteria bacterium Mor1]|nr:SAM-dependent methyltransferase [Acidobacteria bacterium Mor1]
MTTFKDHFSTQSADYARFRPSYPEELYAWLAGQAPGRNLAWDVATGSGQAARGLAPFFERVYASDASAEQINNAVAHHNVEYAVGSCDTSGLAEGSVDLVSVAQALHWFDREVFFEEVRRVSAPGGLVAAWCYGHLTVDSALDPLLLHFYEGVVGPYWPPERVLIEQGYRTLEFAFDEIETPPFAIRRSWNLDQLTGYLGTWSAVQRYRADRGEDPIPVLRRELELRWGDAAAEREIRWPLSLRAGRVAEGRGR